MRNTRISCHHRGVFRGLIAVCVVTIGLDPILSGQGDPAVRGDFVVATHSTCPPWPSARTRSRGSRAAKAAQLDRSACGGIVTILLDCDPEGEAGMKQALGYLAQLIAVRLAWTSNMYGGNFKGRQPESMSVEEWQQIQVHLKSVDTDG